MLEKNDSISSKFDYFDIQTNIPKRHVFEEILGLEWTRAIHEVHYIAVLFIELDYYENLRTDYDSHYADVCLKKVSESISESTSRPNDFIAHYGNGKFAVILPYTDINGAAKVGNNIVENVLDLNLENKNSPFKVVTVSVGASSFIPIRGLSSSQLLDNADAALDSARWKGRNSIKLS